jgi:hypothetical protein
MYPLLSRIVPGARRSRRVAARNPCPTVLRLTALEERETPAVGFLAVGAPAGADPTVAVLRSDGTVLARFPAYDPGFRGGVHAAAIESPSSPGTVEIVTGAGPGGGPHVRTFSVNTATGAVTPQASFLAFAPAFRGGVNVAAADFNGDGVSDIVTGAGAGGGPHVEVFNGASPQVMSSFLAFDPGFRGGVSVAAGELDGNAADGPELAVGAGPGGGPHVRVFRADGTQFASFFAFPTTFTGGVTLGQAGANQLIVGANGGAAVTQFDFAPDGTVTATARSPGTVLGAFSNPAVVGTLVPGGATTANVALPGFTGVSFTPNGTLIAPAPVSTASVPFGPSSSVGILTGLNTGVGTTTGLGGPSLPGTSSPIPGGTDGVGVPGLGAAGGTVAPVGGTGFQPAMVGTIDEPIGQVF